MATFKFKSSGYKASQPTTEPPITVTPYGIKTPLQLNDKSIFAMHYDLADQIHDNLRNLLLTNWGERVGFYRFGANLRPLCSEISNIEQFDNAAIENIKNAVTTWMPYVNLVNFSSVVDNSSNLSVGVVRITIAYNIPQIGIENKSLQIVLHVI
jgi:phage baseplate assembly protein W